MLERADVWNEKVRRARKPWRCSCCNWPIVPGDRYLAHTSILDGDVTTAALCLPCKDVREKLYADRAYRDLAPSPTYLFEVLEEHRGASDAIDALFFQVASRIGHQARLAQEAA